MSLKPINPGKTRPKRPVRPIGAPVVVVQKKSSGSGGLMMGLILIAALGGGYFVYNNQQKNEAARAAQQAKLEANARAEAENERLRLEHENEKKRRQEEEAASVSATALGTAIPSASSSSTTYTEADTVADETPAEESGEDTALGSTEAPTTGTGMFNAEDTSAPAFDLTAKGKAAKKEQEALEKAITKAGNDGTFHDLQADLKRAFEVAQPGFFADGSTLPAFPPKEEKLLRLAQSVYISLTIAAELEARDTVPDKQHAKFVNWLMKEKGKPARTFSYGLEHYNINDMATATELMNELREAYLIAPSSAEGKIKLILEKAGK